MNFSLRPIGKHQGAGHLYAAVLKENKEPVKCRGIPAGNCAWAQEITSPVR